MLDLNKQIFFAIYLKCILVILKNPFHSSGKM